MGSPPLPLFVLMAGLQGGSLLAGPMGEPLPTGLPGTPVASAPVAEPCPVPPVEDVGGTPAASPALEAWVRGAVGRAWGVAADCVELSWPRGTSGVPDAPVAPLLEGRGAGGRWTVSEEVDGRRLRISVDAAVRMSVPVASRSLARGDVVQATDVEWQTLVRVPRGGEVADGGPEGWVVARATAPGTPLVAPVIRPPVAVRVGQPVDVRWIGTTVDARREGTALRTGSAGDTVEVRLGSGLRRRARVTGMGTVELIQPGAPGRNDR